jgi:hypothetical protein
VDTHLPGFVFIRETATRGVKKMRALLQKT